jgi:hypothetical protein
MLHKNQYLELEEGVLHRLDSTRPLSKAAQMRGGHYRGGTYSFKK